MNKVHGDEEKEKFNKNLDALDRLMEMAAQLKKQSKIFLLNGLQRKLQSKDFISQIVDLVKLALLLSPSFLGMVDVVTNILYLTNQKFGDPSIKELFALFMVFPAFLQFFIWTIFLAQSEERDFTRVSQKYMVRYTDALIRGQRIKAYIQLSKSWLIYIGFVVYNFLKQSHWGTLYAIASQLKLLPFYLSFYYCNADKLKYTISDDLVSEYEMKSWQFHKAQEIDEINEQIRKVNDKIRKQNSSLQDWEKDQRKLQREPKPQIQLSPTDPLTRAIICKRRVFWTDRILENAMLRRFLTIGDLIQAVFQSLPMLVLQYINNSITLQWNSQLAVTSLAISFVLVFFHACQMVYKLSLGETFPLIRLMKFIESKNAYQSPNWLFGIKEPQSFEIQTEKELINYSLADLEFFENVDRIIYNVSADEESLRKAQCGKTKLFQYLSLLTGKLCSANQVIFDFNDNRELDFQDVKELLIGFKWSEVKSYCLKMNNIKIEKLESTVNFEASEHLKVLQLDLAGWDLVIVDKVDIPATLQRAHFNLMNAKNLEKLFELLFNNLGLLKDLRDLSLNFSFTEFRDLKEVSGALALLDLERLTLNFDGTFIETLEPLGKALSHQVNLKNLILQVFDNPISQLDPIIISMEHLKKIESIDIFSGKTKMTSIDCFQDILPQLHHLQHLNFNFGLTQVTCLTKFSAGLSNITSLQSLVLYMGSNRIKDIGSLSLEKLMKLKDLRIGLPKTDITNLQWLKIKHLHALTTLKLNFEGTQVDNIQLMSEQIAELFSLKKLEINLKSTKVSDVQPLSDALLVLNNQSLRLKLNLEQWFLKALRFTLVDPIKRKTYDHLDEFLDDMKEENTQSAVSGQKDPFTLKS